MKIKFTILLFVAPVVVAASGWQLEYTFQEERIDGITMLGSEYVCIPKSFGKDNHLFKGSTLESWSRYNSQLPSDLYDSIWSFVDINWTETQSIGNKLITVFHKREYDLGNASVGNLVSLISDNGITWTDLRNALPVKFPAKIGSTKTLNEWSVVVDAYPEFGGFSPNSLYRTVYDSASNTWESEYIGATDQEVFRYFSDNSKAYLSYSLNWGTTETKTLYYDGAQSGLLGSVYLRNGVAHDGKIIGDPKDYSPMHGWVDSSADLNNIENILFNGQRMVGVINNSDLGWSDDFGQSWEITQIGDIRNVSFIEDNQQYIALISSSTNSSIYTLSALPDPRINGFRIDNNGIYFEATSNVMYQAECTTNLLNANWLPYGLPVSGVESNIVIALPENSDTEMFFRIRASNE